MPIFARAQHHRQTYAQPAPRPASTTPAASSAPQRPAIAGDGLALTGRPAAPGGTTLKVDRPRVQATVNGQQAPNGTVAVTGQGQAQLKGGPVNAQAAVVLKPGGETHVKVAAQGTVKEKAVTGDVAVDVVPRSEGKTSVKVDANATAAVKGGAQAGVTVKVGPEAKTEGRPPVEAAIDVGPDVMRMARQMAYQQTRQAIRNRQIPDVDVPDLAKQALVKLGSMNEGGKYTGAIQVNVSNPQLVEAVRQGVTQGIKDQPFRNRGLIRPQGMWRVRAAIAESRPVQRAVIRTVSAEVAKTEGQVSAMSNGVVAFTNRASSHTGAVLTYNGSNVQVQVRGHVNDVQQWLPR